MAIQNISDIEALIEQYQGQLRIAVTDINRPEINQRRLEALLKQREKLNHDIEHLSELCSNAQERHDTALRRLEELQQQKLDALNYSKARKIEELRQQILELSKTHGIDVATLLKGSDE